MIVDWRRHRLGTGRTGGAALRARLDVLASEERPPVRVIVPPAAPSPYVSEAGFQRVVVDLAELCGWLCWHDEDSRKNDAGLPDLILVRERLLWWEVKTQRGKLRPVQQVFGRRLLRSGQDWRVIRPSDWDYVVATLTKQEG
jgi:hypothetical protein